MRDQTISLLRCPACEGNLARPTPLPTSAGSDHLACDTCTEQWVIEDGIPDFVFPRELEGRDADSRSMWDRVGRFYDLIGSLTNVIRGVSGAEERQELIDRLDLQPTSIVLEVAAGTGNNLIVMAERVGCAGTVIGLDLSKRMIRQAHRKLSKTGRPFDLILGNAQRLPFQDNALDAVLDGFGMKYYADKHRAISEMIRIVKPGGKVVIAELGVPQGEAMGIRQRVLSALIPHFVEPPPLAAIPTGVLSTTVSWDPNKTAYAIEFSKVG